MTSSDQSSIAQYTAEPALRSLVRMGGPVDLARPVEFTIGTLVTDPAQHAAMRATFTAAGFTDEDCETFIIDNTGRDQTCAFRGLDAMLTAARGRWVILCHQDVRLTHDRRERLEACLAGLEGHDPDWALAGNAGGMAPGRLALRISDPHGADQNTEGLPVRVMSLDENFIVVRRSARIGFSRDLAGFHFYGADICLNAEIAGYRAYVIDFHLTHLSPGKIDASFHASEAAFRAKWARALRPRWMQTTCSLVRLTGTAAGALVGGLVRAPYAKLARRIARRPAARAEAGAG